MSRRLSPRRELTLSHDRATNKLSTRRKALMLLDKNLGKKKCTVCRRHLFPDAFHKNSGSTDGLMSVCRECRKSRKKPDILPPGYRQCRICDNVLPDYKFYDCKTATRKTCIECSEKKWSKSYQKKTPRVGNGKLTLFGYFIWSRMETKKRKRLKGIDKKYKNSEKGRAKRKEWLANNKYKIAWYSQARNAKKAGMVNDMTYEQWLNTLETFGYKCSYCGKVPDKLTQDHWIPIASGGAYTFGNIVPACKSCNSKKGKKHPIHFLDSETYQEVLKTLTKLINNNECPD